VKDVLALEDNARARAETLSIANRAVIITFLAECSILILFYAFLVNAWKALSFTRKPVARVAASQYFVASFIHQLNAGLFSAHILESWFDRGRGLLE
jgi:hypothetical protein